MCFEQLKKLLSNANGDNNDRSSKLMNLSNNSLRKLTAVNLSVVLQHRQV